MATFFNYICTVLFVSMTPEARIKTLIKDFILHCTVLEFGPGIRRK